MCRAGRVLRRHADRPDEEAAIGLADENAAVDQFPDGFAQRRPADVELPRQCGLGQPLTGCEVAAGDHGVELSGDLGAQSAVFDRSEGGVRAGHELCRMLSWISAL